MKNSLIVLLFFLSVSILYAQDTINVPFDYPTIQEGINASVNGDVVLVHPGSYYENFNFSGKLITVASLFLTTQDTNYIYQTVVEGDTCESVIFESGEDSTARLIGFTFQNAHILLDTRGVIYCVNSSPVIMNNRIINNTIGSWPNIGGGGIVCIDASPFIGNNIISDNDIRTLGGGIYCRNSSPTIIDNIIKYNHVGDLDIGIGGGIYCENSSPYIEGNYITDNCVAGGVIASGGGIYCTNSSGNIVGNYITDNCAGGGWGRIGAGIYCNEASNLQIHNCNISGNSHFGVFSGNNVIINAEYNWWGDASGPYHPILNPEGLGNAVSDSVLFVPWLTVPIPVELTSFTATTQAGKVILNWTTATETNNLGFEIERKIITEGAGEWITIGFREGYGTTTEFKEYFYVDDISSITANSLAYRLKQIDFNGSYEYSDEVLVENPAPMDYTLHQNFPNPFNPVTTINYSLPLKSQVELIIYNALGESVIQLVNEVKEAGRHSVELNTESLPSGVYFYRLQAGDFVETKKMVLLK